MRHAKWLSLLLPLGIAAGSALFLGTGTASAEETVPVATAVPVATGTTEVETVQEGWLETENGRMYQYEDGSFAVGVNTIDGVAYLFDYAGVQKTGWRTVNGVRQYYDPDTGELCTGWVEYADHRYYADPDSGKQTGEITLDGVRYSLDATYGIQKLGFVTLSDKTVHYYDNTGTAATGWSTADTTNQRYYFGTDGVMRTGWQTISGSTYHFTDSGTVQIGFQTIGGSRYFFDTSGAMYTGWKTYNGSTYYFDTAGIMQTGFQTIGDNRYYFETSGTMHTGWLTVGSSKYYFQNDGTMVIGKVVTIDGKKCTFTESGVYKTIKICIDAGHYGKYNQSPVNSAYYESDMSWNLSIKLKAALESYGIEVVMTRTDKNTDLGLEDRGKASAGCDLFLSLHSNAASVSADGPMACCTITGEMDVLGQQLANTVATTMGTSQKGTIWKRVGENGNYYGVLRGAAKVGTPGILLEHSYHTNLRATNWLLVDSNLQALAEAEAKTIATYFGMA